MFVIDALPPRHCQKLFGFLAVELAATFQFDIGRQGGAHLALVPVKVAVGE
jgi:hypothetical protein